jgi:ferric-dicitrate binding protein FerR (iron transport regulator)
LPAKEKLKELFTRFLNNQCSEKEIEWLMQEFETGNNQELLKDLVQQQLESIPDHGVYTTEVTQVYQRLSDQIRSSVKQTPVTPRVTAMWKRMAVAASVLVALAIGYGLFYNNKKDKAVSEKNYLALKDFSPGGDRAMLRLADGSTIILDSAHNGTLGQEGNTRILKLNNGELAYNSISKQAGEILYNTITTPRGGQYQVTLSDGTKVWLNAASSLHFPTVFSGKERRVEITGEAYFEVAHNAAMPFIVKNGEAEVRVLGTHFNVNAYNDESSVKVSLLEGKVNVMQLNTQRSQMLAPGQQASLSTGSAIKVKTDVDMDAVMAWKNGLFDFSSADIKTIMRQVGRWYDIDVSYEGNIPEREFSGKISRNTNASNVLKILEQSNIHFRIENKKIVVLP